MLRIFSFLLLPSFVLVGCAGSPPKTLYQWEEYQPQVYHYFKTKEEGQEGALATMELENGLQQIRVQGGNPPPGYHAHLGLLYSIAGKSDQAMAQFQAEKKLFPESTIFMDFLLKGQATSQLQR